MTTLVLTAAVTPSVSDHLVVAEPDVRRDQYRASIARWATAADEGGFSLAIVETSGAPESTLLGGVRTRSPLLFHSYQPSDEQVERGKGAIEIAALMSLLAARPWDRTETLYKCTGRLFVSNARRVVTPLPPASLRARMTLDRSWIDTRLFGAPIDVWNDVVGDAGRSVDDHRERPIERELALRVSPRLGAGSLTWSRFPERPFFEGVSGTSGTTYSSARSKFANVLLAGVEKQLVRLASRKQA